MKLHPRHSLVSIAAPVTLALALAGCASLPSSAELDAQALAAVKASFRDQGIAKVDRIAQDETQRACSSDKPPAPEVVQRLQAQAMASIKWPADGQYLGDWREGEKLAQSGRGMTWTDADANTASNGGNCYNCHEIDPKEISHGTIGPSLHHYGKLRGVKDPADPASAAIVQYTWAKLWNSTGVAACSLMPRFGHKGVLNETQIRHLMALLLDPKSPVNQ
jgi:L-cysteine S-thiosulfotransferase